MSYFLWGFTVSHQVFFLHLTYGWLVFLYIVKIVKCSDNESVFQVALTRVDVSRLLGKKKWIQDFYKLDNLISDKFKENKVNYLFELK